MRRLCITLTIGLGILIFGTACQPESNQPYRIGVINFLPVMDNVLDGFKQGMRDQGYVEGVDIEYIYDGPAANLLDLNSIASDLIENDEVDMLISFSTGATRAAHDAVQGTDIPVVFVPVTDPVRNDFIGVDKNLTGIANGGSDAKRLELLLELDPSIKKLYVPYNPDDGSAAIALEDTQEAAIELNVEIVANKVYNVDDIEIAIDTMPADVDGVFLLPDILTVSRTDWFLDEVFARGIVLAGSTTTAVEGGALMAFGVDFFNSGYQASRLAEQIITGTPPADLPVEVGEFFLHINLNTAEGIGLEISDEILDQADKVINQ